MRPYQPKEHLRATLSVGDVHLVSLDPGLEGLIVPSKFYGIAAAGRPTIFIGSKNGEFARLLEEWVRLYRRDERGPGANATPTRTRQ